MHVSHLNTGMTRMLSFLSLLLLLGKAEGAPSPAVPPPAVHAAAAFVPIGVGYNQENRQQALNKGFGMFSKEHSLIDNEVFTMCGSHTLSFANTAFTTASSITLKIDCEPHPSRILVAATAQTIPAFPRDMKKDCEMLVCSANAYPSGSTGTSANGVALTHPAAEKSTVNVCSDKLPEYPKGSAATQLFANEGNCYEADKNLKNTFDQNTFSQVPRWLPSTESTLNIRPFISAGYNDPRAHRPPLVFETPTTRTTDFQACDASCDSGNVVKVKFPAQKEYKMIFWLSNDCPAFRICYGIDDQSFDGGSVPVCYAGREIDVLLDNGVVVWPGDMAASVIELKSRHRDPLMPVVVEFGYTAQAEFYVGNVYREVVSTGVGYNPEQTKNIAIFFPKEDCLKDKAGIFSRQIQSASAMSSKKLEKGDVTREELGGVNNQDYYDVSTTTVPPSSALPHSTTPAPDREGDGSGAPSYQDVNGETGNNSSGVYTDGKWWAWGIYIGFVIGTLLTLAIGGGLFYVLRRTVFGVWYRGMYKRYGCDASGTTGGITGVGFGATETGTVTIQGTTGGGTTGGGTSGKSSVSEMSTMGGTTGGTTGGGGTTGTSVTM